MMKVSFTWELTTLLHPLDAEYCWFSRCYNNHGGINAFIWSMFADWYIMICNIKLQTLCQSVTWWQVRGVRWWRWSHLGVTGSVVTGSVVTGQSPVSLNLPNQTEPHSGPPATGHRHLSTDTPQTSSRETFQLFPFLMRHSSCLSLISIYSARVNRHLKLWSYQVWRV